MTPVVLDVKDYVGHKDGAPMFVSARLHVGDVHAETVDGVTRVGDVVFREVAPDRNAIAFRQIPWGGA